jgi:hypothetical protein
MTTVDVGILEVTDWEAWFAEDCGCEAQHFVPEECTVTVVAFAVSCDDSLRVCRFAVKRIAEDMASLMRCASCNRPAADCWRVFPI